MIDQKQILETIAEELTLPVADVDVHASLQDDLGLNPVEVADLLQGLAMKFSILFDQEDTEHLKTVGDIVELVEDKLLD